jgi:hypothetical protein
VLTVWPELALASAPDWTTGWQRDWGRTLGQTDPGTDPKILRGGGWQGP